MLGKPFRSPLLVKKDTPAMSNGHEPQAKKRRISGPNDTGKEQSGPQLVFKAAGISSLPRKPLLTVHNPAIAAGVPKPQDAGVEGYYNVLWSVTYQ